MNAEPTKYLIVLAGPTGVGKTDVSIEVARRLGAHIVSSDSRQIYREMRIGTAVPTQEQLSAVPHHFIQCRSIGEPYTAGRYENEALSLLEQLYQESDYALLCGGSGLYIDALCNGIDAVPGTNAALRQELTRKWQQEGLEVLLQQLQSLDPEHYKQMDRSNPQRVVRALEVCIETGQPYSALRKNSEKKRPFRVLRLCLTRPREELYRRIDRRVETMMQQGLAEEAQRLYPQRHLNALRTVGYTELFDHFEGRHSLEKAVELIQRNSRRYAKRQLTWFGRDDACTWFDLSRAGADELLLHIEQSTR